MRTYIRRSTLIIALLAIFSMFIPTAQAAPGDVDTTFGGFGTAGVVTASGLRITGMAVQPDGKTVVAGYTNTANELVVYRYLPNGQLDATFSDDGKALFPDMFDVTEVAVQSDGRIVVGGYASSFIYLARLTPDGALDMSFDDDGWAIDTAAGVNYISAILVQANGMIVACGNAEVGNDDDFSVLRYTVEGARDNTFGGDGKVTIGFGGNDSCRDIVQQRDGKLVLAGAMNDDNIITNDNDFAVARLEINGTLDDDNGDGGFDGDGKLTTDFGGDEYGKAVALQSDGKIVVLGTIFPTAFASRMARYLPNGKLDTSFDGDGKLAIPTDVLHDLALQPDGKLLALGYHTSPDGDSKFALHRLLADGQPDPTFNDGGKAWLDFGGADVGEQLALLPDGRILAAGSKGSTALLVRLWPDGTLDTGGKQTLSLAAPPLYDPGSDAMPSALAVQPDGKLLVAGELRNPAGTISDAVITRFLPDGQLDPSFGTGGTVRFDLGIFDVARAIALQPDGKIVIAGSSDFGGGWVDFMVARYHPSGARDTTFGENGNEYRLANFANDASLDYGQALALAPDGKIVVAGNAWNGARLVWGVARWHADGTPDTAFDSDGKVFVNFTHFNTAKAVVVQPDGKIIVGGDYNGDFFLQRLLVNGERDASYGINGGGYNVTDMGGTDSLTALALAPDGWLYAGGYSWRGAADDFALAQYRPDGLLAECPIDQPCSHWPSGKRYVDIGALDTVAALVLRTDNQLVAAGCTDNHMVAAQVSTSGVSDQPLVFRTGFVGPFDCTYGVGLTGPRQNKLVLAGQQHSNGDGTSKINIALAKFTTTDLGAVPTPSATATATGPAGTATTTTGTPPATTTGTPLATTTGTPPATTTGTPPATTTTGTPPATTTGTPPAATTTGTPPAATTTAGTPLPTATTGTQPTSGFRVYLPRIAR